MRSGATTVRPSGLRQPDAIFARNLFGATPAEAVSAVVSRIAAFNRFATSTPSVSPHAFSVDVEVRLVQRQRLDQRRHVAIDREDLQKRPPGTSRKSGDTILSSGQSRTARLIGMADRTPNARAS